MNADIQAGARALREHICRVLETWHERLQTARDEESEDYVIAWYQLTGASAEMMTALNELAGEETGDEQQLPADIR